MGGGNKIRYCKQTRTDGSCEQIWKQEQSQSGIFHRAASSIELDLLGKKISDQMIWYSWKEYGKWVCLKMSSEQNYLEGVYMVRSWEVESRSINECIETQSQSCILKSFGSQWKLQTVCCTESCLWDFRTNLAVNHATVDSKINTTITNKWKRPHLKHLVETAGLNWKKIPLLGKTTSVLNTVQCSDLG